MKRNRIILTAAAIGLSMTAGAFAEDVAFNNARIYVNPGHGGWGANDRNLTTINHAMGDTIGFYETNTNLRKGLRLYHDLVDNKAGKVFISRTKNGIDEDCTKDGVPQLVGLSTISADVEANNVDYFISIHSNAATEGSSVNYPLVLYRGTDDEVGNGLKDAKQMGIDAWPFINNNGVTYKSYYTKPTDCNVRGDMTFMGGSLTTMGYTGYYGVLRHGADGYLVEGCFHTYQPERHRLLNENYCQQEGMRYARAIRSWFNGPKETTGDIMGSVKNATKPLENALYKYKAASIDAYAPLNEVTVVLKDANGKEVAKYTTDNEYNGIFVFEHLAPGKYTLDFTGLTDYHPYTEEIEVVANTTVFSNVKLTSINEDMPDEEVIPEVEYYTHPAQDGDIAAGSEYTFAKDGDIRTATALNGLTVRRSILRNGKYYVLAHDGNRTPHLMVINPADGSLIKEMSLEGLVTTGFNGKNMSWTLSDIAFTNDGVLIGSNSVVIGRSGNGYCNGDFYMYAWKGDDTTPLEDQKPVVVTTLPTNDTNSIGAAGNNYSNLMANSFVINGNFDDFNFYFDSHAGNGWTTSYGMRYVCWTMKKGERVAYQWTDADEKYDESQFGEDAMMTLSPLALNRFMVDGSKMPLKEFEISLLTNVTTDMPEFNDKSINTATSGANYFRYAKNIFMTTPVYKDNSYGLRLYDITSGLDKAEKIGEVENLITADGVLPMNSYGVVNNADIDLYLMVGDKIAKVTTSGIEQKSGFGRIFAYDLKQDAVGNDQIVLSFKTNIPAKKASVVLKNENTKAQVLTLDAVAGEDNVYTATVNKNDIPEGTTCNWTVAVAADNVTRFKKVSEKTAELEFYSPYGIAIDNSPESPYFGNIYISNTAKGNTEKRGESGVGIYAFNADGTPLNSVVYNCNINWTGKSGEGPRRLAVAADGRIFACDNSKTNTGIYYIDPATFNGAPLFTGATNDGAGKLSINGTYVGGKITSIGVRGEGEKTQLYAVDASASGASWKKTFQRYDIGTSNTWTAAPSDSRVTSNYVGNDNNSIVPVSTGFWAAQYRGKGSSSGANPCLLYFSDKHNETVFDSSSLDNESSQNGALAVDEKNGIVAYSYNGGVRVLHYKLNKEAVPEVTVLFEAPLADQGDYSNSFAFDYAGNLYAVSNSGECVSVYAMPTSDNYCEVPAKKSMVVKFTETGVEELAAEGIQSKVYPNPATDNATVVCAEAINNVVVYNVANGAEALRIAGNGENSMTIDVADLAQGMYLVKVNGTYTMKLIKK